MFKQTFGSPRLNNNQAPTQQTSILSPRNFLKLISDGFDGLRRPNVNSPNQANYQQFVATFEPYLKTFEQEYKRYTESKNLKKNLNSKNDELQLELKLSKIPQSYFLQGQKYQLELYRRGEAKKKQEEMSEYLDEIELILFTKSGKYPQKSQIIMDNMASLGVEVDSSLKKVINFRVHLKEKLFKISQKQARVRRKQKKLEKIKQTIRYIEVMKTMKNLKDFSSSSKQQDQKDHSNENILLKIKKSDLQCCHKIPSLSTIVKNIENYRNAVKQKLYKQFLSQIEYVFNKLLQYNKQEWKNINVPQTIFNNSGEVDMTTNNITVLDQSYFAFEANQVNIVGSRVKAKQPSTITEQNQEDDRDQEEVLDLSKIYKLWEVIKQFDLYDQQQVNQNFTKILVKHNIVFNHDMQEYLSYLYDTYVKEKQNTESILKGPTTYASLKGRKAKQEKAKDISSQTQIQISEEKISVIDMKLFVKIVKYEFALLKKVLSFIEEYKQLEFMANFKPKFAQFLESNITYFTNLKKVNHQLSAEDFLSYLEIIDYWDQEDYYQILVFCQKLKNDKIDEYLTAMQKNLLIKDLKIAIEQSSYLPVNVSSDNYMIFHSMLSPEASPQLEQDINMSVTLHYDEDRPVDETQQSAQNVVLRLINKTIIYKDKAYRICDSFLELLKNIDKYLKLKQNLTDYQQNIEEKICELIGFYAWYNQKNLTSQKNGAKTLKNFCAFYSTLLLLQEIMTNLNITNKKIDKTKIQLSDCQTQINKSITMTPFITIEAQISKLYESKISAKAPLPTAETQRIIDILKISFDCLKEYFPIEYEEKLHQSLLFKFMQTTIKLIQKNYCGYLSNMEKRGLLEVKWFLPKLREVAQITVTRDNNLVNKKGQLLIKDGSSTFCMFAEEIETMDRTVRQKLLGV